MYVVIEGVDTAGKSTQLDILKKNHTEAIFTKEPGGTEIGLKLREMALNGEAKSKTAEMFLFLADRAEHIEQIIKPNEKKMIISDRSAISGISYAKDLPLEVVTSLNLIATQNTLPSHVILLELSKEELTKRLGNKSNDSIESRGIDYLLDIQERMKKTIEMLNLNHIYIDASLSIEQIAEKIEGFING
ncbi:dTMP kinase [Halarcobacter bivalviorum]|uniref:Thymidylate kinase n=1 Tax=Halarcobacter bivalviorum TaxID=663364 RepID=A0AAX2AB94_9BACT|nr:dTMP kinase [Halarcobacter bivalviorum]AXH12519.1 dTMP kinase [Halarcobacter bivalviorum]RXK10558.1 dTMP kinase [Halarcobacter bivalviorum]